jgi:hypothetical protein
MLYIGCGTGVLNAQDVVVHSNQPEPKSRVISVTEYKSLLEDWTRFFENERPEDCCGHPAGSEENITVKDNGVEYTVPTAFLREKTPEYFDDEDDDDGKPDLAKKAEAKRKWAVLRHDRMLTYLRTLRENLDVTNQPANATQAAQAESSAKAVLALRDFRLVKTPGTEKSWQERFSEWLQSWLNRLSPKLPSVRVVSQTLLWLIFAVVILGAGSLVKRWLEREEAEEFKWRLGSASGQVSSKHWRLWMDEARDAGMHGDWRQAVRLGYWAAISSLESSGAWKPDRARTPREYLGLLATSHQYRSALTNMTKDFERVWYAQMPATEEDYQQILRGLEFIGCR